MKMMTREELMAKSHEELVEMLLSMAKNGGKCEGGSCEGKPAGGSCKGGSCSGGAAKGGSCKS